MDYKISAQNDIIEVVLLALKEVSQGIGIAAGCDIERHTGDYGSTLVFTPKEGVNITPQDFFWLGYYLARDFKPELSSVKIVTDKEREEYRRKEGRKKAEQTKLLRRDDGS